jgi:excisionase family DNA binding protein
MEKKPIPIRLLRATEVAEALGISKALAYRWMSDGTLPVTRYGRTVRVSEGALLDWVKERTNQPREAVSA